MLDAAVAFLWPEAYYNHAFSDEASAALPEFGANQKLWRCRDGYVALIIRLFTSSVMCQPILPRSHPCPLLERPVKGTGF
jgi:hypothetical protein